jgi:hypothetical protein
LPYLKYFWLYMSFGLPADSEVADLKSRNYI